MKTYDKGRRLRYEKSFHKFRSSNLRLFSDLLNVGKHDGIIADLIKSFETLILWQPGTPPDFDIDFSWKDRDEVIDYIFKRFGREHVCLLGSYVTFQSRAVIRELGRVFGLPKEEIDQLEGS